MSCGEGVKILLENFNKKIWNIKKNVVYLCKLKQIKMKKYTPHLFQISLFFLGLITLLLLGAEPNTTESSMYEYEHFTDKGHFGWYLCWSWVFFCVVTITTFILLILDKEK